MILKIYFLKDWEIHFSTEKLKTVSEAKAKENRWELLFETARIEEKMEVMQKNRMVERGFRCNVSHLFPAFFSRRASLRNCLMFLIFISWYILKYNFYFAAQIAYLSWLLPFLKIRTPTSILQTLRLAKKRCELTHTFKVFISFCFRNPYSNWRNRGRLKAKYVRILENSNINMHGKSNEKYNSNWETRYNTVFHSACSKCSYPWKLIIVINMGFVSSFIFFSFRIRNIDNEPVFSLVYQVKC